MPNTKPPVTPAPDLLRFHDENFSWEDFETFSESFLSAQPGMSEVHRYGTRGQKQRGIDFTVRHHGAPWTIQCRHKKKFKLAEAQKTVEETTKEADHHLIMVTTQVGTEVRDYIDTLPTWELWDARDISRKVRELPQDLARALVNVHFGPAWVRAFLRIEPVTPFTKAKPALARAGKLFHHNWTILGRTVEVDALLEFAKSEEQSVALVIGSGGIGKTRILKALADKLPDTTTAYLVDEIPVTTQNLDELPSGPLLLFLDDAHRRERDLALLAAAIKHRPDSTKLVLSSRPWATATLNAIFAQAGVDSSKIARIGPLKPLGSGDSERLAAEALGPGWDRYAARVAAATADSPLITVIASELLKTEQVSPELLEATPTFRELVLARFADVLTGQVGSAHSPETVRRVLDFVAATEPISLRDERVAAAAAGFLKIEPSAFRQIAGELEEGGVLRRRGDELRITPDVLADYLLRRASVTQSGEPTGYAVEIYNAVEPFAARNVLRNLAEVDWRVSSGSGASTDLLRPIWHAIATKYKAATNQERATILGQISDAAAYQPGDVLALVELTMSDQEIRNDPGIHKRLPRLLQSIGLHERHLPRALDLLWELARDTNEPKADQPEHPLRILLDLAAYEPEKPLTFNEGVLEAVERWMKDPNADQHVHLPLEVIGPLFAKSGFVTRSKPASVEFSAFGISPATTAAIRERALRLVTIAVDAESPRVVQSAVAILANVVSRPFSFLGRTVTEEEIGGWGEERQAAMKLLQQLAARTTDPLIQDELFAAVRWETDHETDPTLRVSAERVVAAVRRTNELNLIQYLKSGYRILLPESEEGPTGSNPPPVQVVIREFMEEFPDAVEGAKYLDQQLRRLRMSKTKAAPDYFFITLSREQPSYARGIVQATILDEVPTLSEHLGQFLGPLRESDRDSARTLATQGLETGNDTIVRGVAAAYSPWGDVPSEEDWEILEKLLTSSVPDAKAAAITALGAIGKLAPENAIERLRRVAIGSNQLFATALCLAFRSPLGVPETHLSEDLARELLAKLTPVAELDSYSITALLSAIGARFPRLLISWFEERIRHDLEHDEIRYDPLPHRSGTLDLSSLSRSPEYEDLLRQVRDHCLDAEGMGAYCYPELFELVAQGFGEKVLRVLSEWINSNDEKRLRAIGRLLREAPHSLIFQNRDFVDRLLSAASSMSTTCLEDVAGDLYSVTLSGSRSGKPGQPFPRDIQTRDDARLVLNDLPNGSPARRLYENVLSSAEARIDAQLREGEELGI